MCVPRPPWKALGGVITDFYLKGYTNQSLSWSPAQFLDGSKEGQFLKWDAVAKAWVPFGGGVVNGVGEGGSGGGSNSTSSRGSFPQWDELKGWEARGAGSVEGQLLRWDNSLKTWAPFSGSPGALLQWDAVDGWQAFATGSETGQLLTFNGGTKKWEPSNAVPANGKYVFGSIDGELGWIATEEC
jgi:hypothetical protein